MTILLASHMLNEVEQLCGLIAILHAGRLVFQGAWNEEEAPRYRIRLDDWTTAAPLMEKLGVRVIAKELVALPAPLDSATLIEALVRHGIRVHAVEPMRHSLESFYLNQLSVS